jgi:hypothetical protein
VEFEPYPNYVSPEDRIRELEAENSRLKGVLDSIENRLGDMAALTDSPALAQFCRDLIARTQSTPVAGEPR